MRDILMKRELKIRRLDLAKLLDAGAHPPTVPFSRVVDEAGAARHAVVHQPV